MRMGEFLLQKEKKSEALKETKQRDREKRVDSGSSDRIMDVDWTHRTREHAGEDTNTSDALLAELLEGEGYS